MNSLSDDSLRNIYQFDSTYHTIYKKTLHNIKYRKPLRKIKHIYYGFNGTTKHHNIRITFINILTPEFIQSITH